MSIWTHVLGTIRFDCCPGLNMPEPDVGITCAWDDPEEQWDRCSVPCGSEGSLVISKWEESERSCVARYTITIFGDLRDYDNEQEIINYFKRITKDLDVRQACFTIKAEGKAIRTFVWKDDGLGGFVEVNVLSTK